MREAEDQMVNNGYLQTLQGAYWAYGEGPRIIPVLAFMLTRQKYYDEKYGFVTGSFPFNALWALSHLKSRKAREVIHHYYVRSHDIVALLALKGWDIRHKYGLSAGVLENDFDLYQRPTQKSKLIAHLHMGESVRILSNIPIENNTEMDGRGGPTEYDEILVFRTGQKGYLERASDDFEPTL